MGRIGQPCVAPALLPHLVLQVRPTRASVYRLVAGAVLAALSWRSAGAVVPPPTAAPAANFAGFETPSALPANPTMAAGPTNLVAAATGQIALFAKSGGLQSTRSLDSFFGATLSSSGALFDPRVVYDPHVQRFFVLALDGRSSPESWLRLAVSKSPAPANLDVGATPAQDWWGYDIDADRDGGAQVNDAWADFGQIGFDQSAVYLTANMRHTDAGNTFAYVKVWILPTDGLIDGGAAPTFEIGAAPAAPLANPVSGRPIFSLAPARTLDAGTEYLIETNGLLEGGGGQLTILTVGEAENGPTLTAANLAVPGWRGQTLPTCVQPGAQPPLDAGDTRITDTVARGGRLWAAHTHPDKTNGPTRTEVRWYEIDGETPALLQSGDVADPELCFFYPAIHPDTSGGAALAMGALGRSTFASAVFTERLFVDAPGVMRAPAVLHGGAAVYNVASPLNPWGTYGAIAEDPDTSALWLFHEYAAAPNVWGTWFGRRDTPPPPETTTTTSTSTSTTTTTSTTTSTVTTSSTTSTSTSTSTTSTSTSTTLAVTPRCQVLKLNGVGKQIRRTLACHARAARVGAPASTRCLARAAEFGDVAFARAEAVGRCPGTADTIAGITITCINRVLAALPGTGRCTALKRTAVGTAAATRLICRARALHLPNSLFSCLAKANSKLAATFLAAGDCAGDVSAVTPLTDTTCVLPLNSVLSSR